MKDQLPDQSTMSNGEGNQDLVQEAKKNCRYKEISLTRSYKVFQNLIQAEAQNSAVEDTYATLVQAYKALNRSHEDYVTLVEEAILKAEGNYLKEPFNLYLEAQVARSRAVDKREMAQTLEVLRAAKN